MKYNLASVLTFERPQRGVTPYTLTTLKHIGDLFILEQRKLILCARLPKPQTP